MERAGLTSGVIPSLIVAGLLFMASGADARHAHPHANSNHPVHGSSHDRHKGQPRFAAQPPGRAAAHSRSRAVVQHHHYHYYIGLPATRGSETTRSRRSDSRSHHWDRERRVLSETLHKRR